MAKHSKSKLSTGATRVQEVNYLPMEMTYLGSGIWSYTCWGEEVVQLLYNV